MRYSFDKLFKGVIRHDNALEKLEVDWLGKNSLAEARRPRSVGVDFLSPPHVLLLNQLAQWKKEGPVQAVVFRLREGHRPMQHSVDRHFHEREPFPVVP